MKQNKKMELLGSAPVPKALLAMGIPMMTGMMISAVYNLVDAYFVGNLGTSQMGAISVAFPLGQTVVGLGLLFGTGAASYISRLLGQRNFEQADNAASTSIYGSILSGAVFIIVTVIFLKPMLRILGATDSIMPYAVTYAGIYVISSVFNVFNVTMNNIVTSEGGAKISMCALLSGAVLNMILDPVFIDIFNFGVKGAALATAVSQAVSTIVYLLYIFSKKSVFSFSIRKCRFSKVIFSEIFKIGIPTLVFQLLTSLSIMLINRQANTFLVNTSKEYVDSVIAGMGAVTRVISMGSLMVFGFLKGFQPIAGFSYGAKKYDRLHEAIKTSVLWSTVFCVLFGTAVTIFSENIISHFTSGNAEMISIGKKARMAYGLSFLFFGYCTVYSSLLLAMGKGRAGFIVGALRQGICFVPVIFILPIVSGISGIMYAQPIADIISFIITLFAAIYINRHLYKKLSII